MPDRLDYFGFAHVLMLHGTEAVLRPIIWGWFAQPVEKGDAKF